MVALANISICKERELETSVALTYWFTSLFSFLQMMQNLLLEEGGLVQVESVNLQVATYSKFQPQSPDFLDITNPKAVYPFNSTMEQGTEVFSQIVMMQG